MMETRDHEQTFDFPAVRTRIIFGFGSLGRLPSMVSAYGCSKALIVTDPGLIRAGVVEKVKTVLANGGIRHVVFGEVPQDSSTETIGRALELLRSQSCDIVVGLGGGSSMDTAKAVAFSTSNPPPIIQYAGLNKLKKAGLPVIAIPTTAGTGSEVSYWAAITDDATATKRAIGGDLVFPSAALCDPELTITLPAPITAATGMDALAHAIESFTNKSYQPISDALTIRAIELIGKYLVRAVENGTDREARYMMMLGSTLAGIGMNPTRLGIVHALAMPLGSWGIKIPHGTGNAVLLPHVMDFNLMSNPGAYARVAIALGVDTAGLNNADAAREAVARVRSMNKQMGIPKGLGELGLSEASIPLVCSEALKSDNVTANPRTSTQADLEAICRSAL
jgi:alcohol dehydrogenase class IV